MPVSGAGAGSAGDRQLDGGDVGYANVRGSKVNTERSSRYRRAPGALGKHRPLIIGEGDLVLVPAASHREIGIQPREAYRGHCVISQLWVVSHVECHGEWPRLTRRNKIRAGSEF